VTDANGIYLTGEKSLIFQQKLHRIKNKKVLNWIFCFHLVFGLKVTIEGMSENWARYNFVINEREIKERMEEMREWGKRKRKWRRRERLIGEERKR
jgi:hypothetical protein